MTTYDVLASTCDKLPNMYEFWILPFLYEIWYLLNKQYKMTTFTPTLCLALGREYIFIASCVSSKNKRDDNIFHFDGAYNVCWKQSYLRTKWYVEVGAQIKVCWHQTKIIWSHRKLFKFLTGNIFVGIGLK